MSDPRIAFGRDLAVGTAERVLDALDSLRPIVQVGADVAPTGAAAIVSLVSILGRLFPHVTVEGQATLGHNPWRLGGTADALDAFASTRPKPTRTPALDFHIGIGRGVPGDCLGLGGDDWTCIVGPGPQPVCPGGLGLGLQSAAALVAADVLKRTLSPLGFAHYPLPIPFAWNLLDYRLTRAPEAPTSTPTAVRIALLGAGSVGSSAAALISSACALTGLVDVVDGDSFDPTRNPFRYPASLGGETGPKAAWITGMLRDAGWEAYAHLGSVGQWVAQNGSAGFDGIAISSVDGVDGRSEVADLLARTTLSIGVAGLSLHIQREVLGDGSACPFCDFVDATPALGQAQVWSDLTGLPVERITHLIVSGDTLNEADVDLAVRAGRIEGDNALGVVGRRLADLVGRVYAQATVQVTGATPVRVAAPFVSWMGGVLAAAEITKAAYGFSLVDRRLDLDLSGTPTGFTLGREADRSGRCLCASAIRRRWMRRLYPVA